MYAASILACPCFHFGSCLRAMTAPKKGTPRYKRKLDYNRVNNDKKRKFEQQERLKFKARFLIRAARLAASAEAKKERDEQVRLNNQYMRKVRDLQKEVDELRARVRKQDVKVWAADCNLKRQKEFNLALIKRLGWRQRDSEGKAKGKGKDKEKGKAKGKGTDKEKCKDKVKGNR